MAHSYESVNEDGYKIVVLPLTIKRGGEDSVSITKIYVRNYSLTSVFSFEKQLNFKLKSSYLNFNDDINLNAGYEIVTDFSPASSYEILYDNSINFTPEIEDYVLGIKGDIINDEQFLNFLVSYEPIKEDSQVGFHTAELVVEYYDIQDNFKTFSILLEASCLSNNVGSVDGFELSSISSIHNSLVVDIKIY
jgi:hypothetical protein